MTAAFSQPSPSDLTLLTSVISAVGHRHGLNHDDRQDFSQSVHLRLAERNYDIFVRFGGRSSLRTFLTVVVSRLLLDWRNHHYGKWRPSATARRRGEWAIKLERLVFRDRYSLAEASSRLCDRPGAPRAEVLADLFAELPVRHRRVFSALTDDLPDTRIQDYVEVEEQRRQRRQACVAVASALRSLPAADRRLIVMRYFRGQSIRSIAEMSKVDPNQLYRRMDRVTRSLRASVYDILAKLSPDTALGSSGAVQTVGPAVQGRVHDRGRRQFAARKFTPSTATDPAPSIRGEQRSRSVCIDTGTV